MKNNPIAIFTPQFVLERHKLKSQIRTSANIAPEWEICMESDQRRDGGNKIRTEKRNRVAEKVAELVFLLMACVSIAGVLLICIFLFVNGMPAMNRIGVFAFLTGTEWKPGNDVYGILPMIFGSIYVTAGAVLLGVPIGIFTAIFMASFCPGWLYRIMKPGIDLMAGIPSVVYGFFGLCVLVPLVRNLFGPEFGGNGNSMLTASLLLGMMILPTVINISESAIRAVPERYYEGALALGATHERSIFLTVVPAARSGIMAGVALGMGRAVGEAMAVIMVAGNQARMPRGIFHGIRTLTANIVMEMGYAADLHRDALVATGVVLFLLILWINLLFSLLKRRMVTR